MSRLLYVVVHNWPLKLGAIALATLLYAGLVVSSSAQLFEGSVPIDATGTTADMTVLSDLGAVSQIRYLVPAELGLRIDSSSFRATVDLSGVEPSGGPRSVPVRVVAIDERVQVLDYGPRQIVVAVDAVISRTVPVRAVIGPVPTGLEVGDPVVDDVQVTVRGAASLVNRVAEAQARISVDASGIDVNRLVDLLPVDASGELLAPVDVDPVATQVHLPIFNDRQTKTLPIHPVVVGSPAAGFELAGISVDPLAVAVEGDIDDLLALPVVDTVSVSISGATSDVTATTELDLPDGVQALDSTTITVTVTIRPITSTRTFEAGLLLVGARADRHYETSTDRVLIVIGGPIADLDRLSGADLFVNLDVTGLDVGVHEVTVGANLLTGLTLVGASPDPVMVTITLPAASASPPP